MNTLTQVKIKIKSYFNVVAGYFFTVAVKYFIQTSTLEKV